MSPLVGEIKRGWGTLKSYSPQTWRLRSSTRRVSTPRRRQAFILEWGQGNARVGARGARFLILELIRRSVYTVGLKPGACALRFFGHGAISHDVLRMH